MHPYINEKYETAQLHSLFILLNIMEKIHGELEFVREVGIDEKLCK